MATNFAELAVQKVKNVAISLGKKTSEYFDPASNSGNNFWTSPFGGLAARAQETTNLVSQIPRIELPKPQVNNQVLQTGINLAYGIPESFVNIPRNIVVGGSRIGTELGETIRDKRNINLQNLAGGVAPMAEGYFDVLTAGLTKPAGSIAKSAFEQYTKEGLKSAIAKGALKGAAIGGGGGLTYGLDTQYGKKFDMGEVLKTTASGALLGGTLGGVLAGAGWKKGNIKELTTYSEKTKAQLRNAKGEWTADKVPVKPPSMSEGQWRVQLKINQKLGRNPYEMVSQFDFEDALKADLKPKNRSGIINLGEDLSPTQPTKGGEVGKGKPSFDEWLKQYDDSGFGIYRNPGADEWRSKYIKPLEHEAYTKNISFTSNPIQLEHRLDDKLIGKYTKTQLENMSVRQKSEIVLGKEWANKYNEMIQNPLTDYVQKYYQRTLSPTQPKGGVPEGGMGAKVPTDQGLPVVPVKSKLAPVETAPKLKTQSVTGGQPPSAGSPPSSPIITSDKDLVSRLTQALKTAKPIRAAQEKLYTAARGQKLSKLLRVREKMAGEKGYFQELGALKGELPKAQYESIRQQFDQPSVDRLFNMVKENKVLDDWDKVNAQVGLAKILGEGGGGVPTKSEISKLYEVFGKEFTETLLSKRPIFQQLGDLALQFYNLPRSFMAGVGDFSGTLMQNALFAYRHPVVTAKNFVKQLKFFASEDAFKMSQEEIASRPNYKLMKEAKLSLTDTGPLVTGREEQFMSSIAEKIPGLGRLVKATGRSYTGFLNRMRADVFDQMIEYQRGIGGDINDPKFLRDVGHFINISTGRGDLGQLERIAPVLGQGLFSARKLMATFQTLDPRLYLTSTPAVRKEALYTMLSFLGGATAITQLSKLAGAEVSDDPTSSDYGKIKFGNTRFNLYGPYQQLAVLFSRLWKGYATSSTTGKKMYLGDESNPYAPDRFDLLTRYFESKEHPTLSLIIGALKGNNNLGQPFNAPVEVLNRFVPMILADAYDLYKDHGPVGLLGTIPSILGIPSQTYGSQIPVQETTPAGKPTIKLKPTGGIVEDVMDKITGTPPSNIPQENWSGIVKAKTEKQQLANVKAEVKKNPQSTDKAILNQNNIFVSPEGEFVDVNKVMSMPSSNAYEKALKEKEAYSLANDILKLNVEDQAKAFYSIGVSPEDAVYYNTAKQDNRLKSLYIDEEIGKLDTSNRANLVNFLISQRKEVNGDMVLSNTNIGELADRGIISDAEATMLKNLKIVDGKPVTKLTGRGRKTALKKVSSLPAPTKIKSPNMKSLLAKTKKLQVKKYKFRRNL